MGPILLVTSLESDPTPPQASWWRANWRARARLFLFLSLLASSLMAVVVLSQSQPEPARRPFDRRTRDRVRKLKPDYVVIGNSMVETRIEPNLLSELLAPAKVAVLGVGGSKSAVWYLTLKNQVLSVWRPRRVVVFFRDRELTNPRERAMGAQHYRVERVSLEREPLLERKLAPPAREVVPHLGWQLERFAPVARLHAFTEPALDAWATLTSKWVWPGLDEKSRRTQINALFALQHLRAAQPAAAEPATERELEFAEVVQDSFLPDIVELAKQAKVGLTFVRVRTRLLASGVPVEPALRRYLRDLEEYLRGQQIEYVDLGDADWEALSMYGEGDHIAGRFRRTYTQLFMEKVGSSVFH